VTSLWGGGEGVPPLRARDRGDCQALAAALTLQPKLHTLNLSHLGLPGPPGGSSWISPWGGGSRTTVPGPRERDTLSWQAGIQPAAFLQPQTLSSLRLL